MKGKRFFLFYKKWMDTSPSTRNPFLIYHHIKEIGFLRFLKRDFYGNNFYKYPLDILRAYDELKLYFDEIIVPETMYDIGCGPGVFVDLYKKSKTSTVKGFDFFEDKNQLINPALCDHYYTHNLMQPFHYIYQPAELTLCIEVLEHIPNKSSLIAVENISKLTKHISIVSAAKPGQWGDGHINCREKKWWINIFSKQDMVYQSVLSDKLNTKIKNSILIKKQMPWLMDNFMVFTKK